jgi:radical SAM superfamily enzyme YgiQ (UPF0313 family)
MKYKKVLLVSIPLQDVTRPPAAMPVLATCCEQVGAEYKFVDLNLHLHKTFEKKIVQGIESDLVLGMLSEENKKHFYQVFELLDREIEEFQPDLIASSVFTFESIPPAVTLLEYLNSKNNRSNFSVVLGGIGVDSRNDKLLGTDTFADWVLKNQTAEYIIRGEGEFSFVELLKGNTDYPGINFLAPQQIIDLDSIPSPSYKQINPYDYFYSSDAEVAITGSRGCVRDCSFCDVGHYWDKFIYRSGDKIADDIFSIWQQTGVQKFFLTDSLINGSIKSFRAFNRRLIELRDQNPDFRPHYSGQFICRPIGQMKYKDYEEMKLAGAEDLIIGIEHFSPEIRYHMRKHFDNAAVDWHFETCARLGLKNVLLMLSGYITETLEDHQFNLENLKRYQVLAKSQIIRAINISVAGLVIEEGSPLAEMLNREYPGQDYNNKLWTYAKNPDLTPIERARRASEIVYVASELGYNVLHFEQKLNTLKKLHGMFKEQKIQKIYTINPV